MLSIHHIDELVANNPKMVSIDSLVNLYWALSHLLELGVPGDVVELGCHSGRTSVFLQMIIEHFDPRRTLHVYDSFEGLPAPSQRDGELFDAGDLRATADDLVATFGKWNLNEPVIHVGWFEDTLPDELPERIAFSFLDGDFHDSILTCLRHVWPRLSGDGVVMIDDYCDPAQNPRAWDKLPGVKAACDTFFADRPDRPIALVGCGDMSLAYVRKPRAPYTCGAP
ncbi:MAG: TylF/MycF/NovP-related O-methyltransferase [Egibacteraceae bacterium]